MNVAQQNTLQETVVLRMIELIDVRSPWNRSLWQLGTIQSVREVLECAQATWSGAINSSHALEYVSERCRSQVSADVGIGAQAVRDLLAQKLELLAPPKKTLPKSAGIVLTTEIEELALRASRDYLSRWNTHVATAELTSGTVEQTARLVLTHMLDDGFDGKHLHGFLKATLATTTAKALETVILRGHEMCREPENTYSFAVPIQSGNRAREVASLQNLLLDIDEFREEASKIPNAGPKANVFHRIVSQDSAAVIELSFQARDPHAATSKLHERLMKIEQRATVGRGVTRALGFSPIVLDRTNKKLRDFYFGTKPMIVPSLDRHSLYTDTLDAQLDNALGLLSSVRDLSSVASVAMLWAAVEGLLGHPGAAGIDAADGLAAVVACSFPRAELEDLLRKEIRQEILDSGLKQSLEKAQGSDKARTLLDSLKEHGSNMFLHLEDRASAERVLQIDADPAGTIARIEGYFKDVFRRLYYQRNFVMHAAKFDSVSLASAIRSAPKLVAAGVDRVVHVHAQYVRLPVPPLALASRARNEIAMLGQDGAREIFRLLK
ncbi:hypothetical protein [Crystallibacter degradans]|uniref:hypothetical protein n=1 Tax=Crystallibacter degradans TaxID=2726743 RepID=UPI0014767BBF|nr:hypothetical protein [Arthrobacter sp. SF27]NMR30541.1 hypothetical protein [Arthrobacter sp. SF27]